MPPDCRQTAGGLFSCLRFSRTTRNLTVSIRFLARWLPPNQTRRDPSTYQNNNSTRTNELAEMAPQKVDRSVSKLNPTWTGLTVTTPTVIVPLQFRVVCDCQV